MNQISELAKMIDHSILHPTMTDGELKEGCELGRYYNVASVCIKPYAVAMAVEWLKGSDVMVCTVIGFPHGNSSIDVKVYETDMACKAGAVEIDMVVNIGKVLQLDWEYVYNEIKSIHDTTLKHNAALKVIFENDYLEDDALKIKLCEICTTIGVEFVKTSTGYGFVKGSDGKYSYQGATEHDLKLMRKYSGPKVAVKAAGGVRSLDDLLKVKAWGITRIGATATAAILEEAKKRFGIDDGKSTPSFGQAKGY
ncbi:MAG: deoxyribose-phosphate aldolase [Cyclobacteriaceae bacterium]|nr:deoxyribose-phosphate aldolase [Cyclobacteriaceae bacterium]